MCYLCTYISSQLKASFGTSARNANRWCRYKMRNTAENLPPTVYFHLLLTCCLILGRRFIWYSPSVESQEGGSCLSLQAHWNVQNRFSQKILENSLIDFSGCAHGVQEWSFTVYLPSYISVTGTGFSLDTRNVGTYPKLIKICGKFSTYVTGLSDQAAQFSDKATVFWKK